MKESITKVLPILQCYCGSKNIILNKEYKLFFCSDCKRKYMFENNIVHFITEEDERPFWSEALERSYNGVEFDMQLGYNQQRKQLGNNTPIESLYSFPEQFFDSIAKNKGIIIDLASGPSGYFAPLIDRLDKNSLFIATDACPTLIKAHSRANKTSNFLVFDIDLDKPLPFRNDSIDAFCGNLIMNVEEYKNLIKEAFRALKQGGSYSVIEVFYEKGSSTYEYLINKGAVYSSIETYINFCKTVGFSLIDSKVIVEKTGKINENDLLPLNNNDKWRIQIVRLKK